VQRTEGQRQAHGCGREREQQHLHEQQCQQLQARGAERGAHSDLADARRTAREQ
jgi:hypothetical protein